MDDIKAQEPFGFFTHLHLTELTGHNVHDLPELVELLRNAPGSCIYHHTHRFLKQHQYLSPEPPNDFAYWVTNVLQEDRLGEQLAAIDIIQFSTIRALRERLILVIENHLLKSKNIRTAPEGDELQIMKSRTFIFPTPHSAHSLREFVESLKLVSINSIYFHMFESRLRLEKGTNDFSQWLKNSVHEAGLAQTITQMDPYTQTLEGLRMRICSLIETVLIKKKVIS